MKKNCLYIFLVLLAILVFVTAARAQVVKELELSVSRDFGSSFGTGDIQLQDFAA